MALARHAWHMVKAASLEPSSCKKRDENGPLMQIVNQTAFHLDLGLRQSVKSEPEKVWSVPSKGHMHLPVVRLEPDMLCIRSSPAEGKPLSQIILKRVSAC